MKTKTSIVLASAGFLSGYLVAPSPPPQDSKSAVKDKGLNALTVRAHLPAATAPAPEKVAMNREEDASFAQWEERYKALIAEWGDHEIAAARLLEELDLRYSRWISEQLASLENTSYVERVDAIGNMQESIRDGAAAIIDHLRIAGSRQTAVLAGSMDTLTAEVQYGMSAGTHEQRMALLKLDREREIRLGALLADTGDDTKVQAMGELDGWYDAGLRAISGSDELN